MEFFLIPFLLLAAAAVYEYRVRRPDQVVVYEKRDGVGVRHGRFYARHFGTPVTTTAHSFAQTVAASARGNLDVRVNLAVTVAAAPDNLAALMRAGGWAADAVVRASKELETILLGQVREYAEKHEIGEITSEGIRGHLRGRMNESRQALGLELVALTVTSSEPTDEQIAEALRRREHARILEQTEALNQQTRIAAARTRISADEEIVKMESDLEQKKADLNVIRFEKESALATRRAEHELSLKRKQLDHEKHELGLLKENPELLLLTPQAARLAEASQSLRNARTVVSLSGNDLPQGAELLTMLQTLLQNAIERHRTKKTT